MINAFVTIHCDRCNQAKLESGLSSVLKNRELTFRIRNSFGWKFTKKESICSWCVKGKK